MRGTYQIKYSKKRLALGLTAFMLAAACAAGATALVCRNQAYAAEVEREIFSEDFDGKTFSDSWKDPVNAELQVGEYSMRYNGSSRWGRQLVP